MSANGYRGRLERLLAPADVAIDGSRPWDLRVHHEELFARLFAEGSVGLGESYMDGWWDCERLDELFFRALRAGIDRRVGSWRQVFPYLRARLSNRQSRRRAFRIGRHHYDIGNDLYRRMLDRRMIYSCAYWRRAETLDDAQEAKLDLVCRKLGLEPGMRVLDVGCGWGGAACFAAERYGVEVVGITVSEAQARLARGTAAGLPVEIRLEDYRSLAPERDGTFDRIFSLGMFEHVGVKNYRTFLATVRRLLRADDGLFLLHTIGSNLSVHRADPWFDRYIFPDGMLPSARQITAAAEGLWVLEDWHSFGADYDRTLMAWHENVERGWQELAASYDERFRRMWRYYLLSLAGGFRARRNQLWQVVLSPRGAPGGYVAPR